MIFGIIVGFIAEQSLGVIFVFMLEPIVVPILEVGCLSVCDYSEF